MATIQELGGDYGLQRLIYWNNDSHSDQDFFYKKMPFKLFLPIFSIVFFPRFVGNFGAIVFAPVGGWLIDSWNLPGTDFR